ncbi:unnamed protein product [Amoebophrya sp. A120]|nr:unnamed protein product [Amoebophrya sp. A120]|eukprot:GSA120T00025964001.1
MDVVQQQTNLQVNGSQPSNLQSTLLNPASPPELLGQHAVPNTEPAAHQQPAPLHLPNPANAPQVAGPPGDGGSSSPGTASASMRSGTTISYTASSLRHTTPHLREERNFAIEDLRYAKRQLDQARRVKALAIQQRDHYKQQADRLNKHQRDVYSRVASLETELQSARVLAEFYKSRLDFYKMNDARDEESRNLEEQIRNEQGKCWGLRHKLRDAESELRRKETELQLAETRWNSLKPSVAKLLESAENHEKRALNNYREYDCFNKADCDHWCKTFVLSRDSFARDISVLQAFIAKTVPREAIPEDVAAIVNELADSSDYCWPDQDTLVISNRDNTPYDPDKRNTWPATDLADKERVSGTITSLPDAIDIISQLAITCSHRMQEATMYKAELEQMWAKTSSDDTAFDQVDSKRSGSSLPRSADQRTQMLDTRIAELQKQLQQKGAKLAETDSNLNNLVERTRRFFAREENRLSEEKTKELEEDLDKMRSRALERWDNNASRLQAAVERAQRQLHQQHCSAAVDNTALQQAAQQSDGPTYIDSALEAVRDMRPLVETLSQPAALADAHNKMKNGKDEVADLRNLVEELHCARIRNQNEEEVARQEAKLQEILSTNYPATIGAAQRVDNVIDAIGGVGQFRVVNTSLYDPTVGAATRSLRELAPATNPIAAKLASQVEDLAREVWFKTRLLRERDQKSPGSAAINPGISSGVSTPAAASDRMTKDELLQRQATQLAQVRFERDLYRTALRRCYVDQGLQYFDSGDMYEFYDEEANARSRSVRLLHRIRAVTKHADKLMDQLHNNYVFQQQLLWNEALEAEFRADRKGPQKNNLPALNRAAEEPAKASTGLSESSTPAGRHYSATELSQQLVAVSNSALLARETILKQQLHIKKLLADQDVLKVELKQQAGASKYLRLSIAKTKPELKEEVTKLYHSFLKQDWTFLEELPADMDQDLVGSARSYASHYTFLVAYGARFFMDPRFVEIADRSEQTFIHQPLDTTTSKTEINASTSSSAPKVRQHMPQLYDPTLAAEIFQKQAEQIKKLEQEKDARKAIAGRRTAEGLNNNSRNYEPTGGLAGELTAAGFSSSSGAPSSSSAKQVSVPESLLPRVERSDTTGAAASSSSVSGKEVVENNSSATPATSQGPTTNNSSASTTSTAAVLNRRKQSSSPTEGAPVRKRRHTITGYHNFLRQEGRTVQGGHSGGKL